MEFEPDDMRSAARTFDAIRTTVEGDLVRATGTALPAMPPYLAAHVRSGLTGLRGRAHDTSRALQSVPDELRFRAFLADIADGPGGTSSGGVPWGKIFDESSGVASDEIQEFARLWKKWTHVTGHWRTTANGTRTWVQPHWRNLGRDIASHAGTVKKLVAASRAFKAVGVVFDTIDVVNAFHAPAAKRNEAVGKASGAMAGGLAAGYGGALAGVAIGTAIFPGVGTVVGGIAGGLIGGAIGSGLGGWAGGQIGKHATSIKNGVVTGAKKVGEFGGKALGGAKKALSSLNPF
jgi:hypothetical protein